MMFTAFPLVAFDEPSHRLPVRSLNVPRLCGELFVRLDVLEHRLLAKSKAPLQWIQDLHDNDFILFVTEVLQSAQDTILIVQQVAQDDYQTPSSNALRHLVK